MTETTSATPPGAPTWYMLSSDEVAARLGVDLGSGLSSAEAASRLKTTVRTSSLLRSRCRVGDAFLDQYRSYMQVILVAAAALSLVIGQYTTALAVFLITVLNAVVGLRQQGKADSAMNALKSMMQESARVRRDGTEVGHSVPNRSSSVTSSC